jgi:2-(1,2-epoxy-1,2-dihydrophenyl)acetyl-CoA isomerase
MTSEGKTYQGFTFERRDPGIGLIVFRHPERLNAMSFGTRRDVTELIQRSQLDDSVRVIVITGEGRGFVAGVNNTQAFAEPPTLTTDRAGGARNAINLYGQLVQFAQEPMRTIRRLDKMVIAAVNGYAIQLGLSIALASDFVIAARSAMLGSATLRMGLQPDEGGHWLLVEHLGVRRAMEFVMRRTLASADEALRLGLVNEVVDDERLLDRALELAHELASGPQVAMRLLKPAIYNAPHVTFEQAGADIAARAAISDYHEDAAEGMEAFRSKRAPTFNAWLPGGEVGKGEG